MANNDDGDESCNDVQSSQRRCRPKKAARCSFGGWPSVAQEDRPEPRHFDAADFADRLVLKSARRDRALPLLSFHERLSPTSGTALVSWPLPTPAQLFRNLR